MINIKNGDLKRLNFHIINIFACSVAMACMLLSCKNSISTTKPTKITSTTATSGGIVESDLDSVIMERGICYSTNPNPEISLNRDNCIEGGKGLGQFTSVMTGLMGATKYYVRAYAIDYSNNIAKIKYGNEVSFNTQVATLASLITTKNNSYYGGELIDNGGAGIKERGICYNTSPNPTISDSEVVIYQNRSGDDNSFELFPKLTKGIIYYIRAYATNVIGTAYGKEIIAGVPSTVCSGNGWEGAAIYNPSKIGVHPIYGFGNISIPKEWEPSSLSLVELIVCSDERNVYIRTCYYGTSGDIG